MDKLEPEIGRVVFSKSGRDMGRYFIIVGIEDKDYVLIADGKVRTLSKPKRKKLKHLNLHADVLDAIAEKLNGGKKVYDKEVGSALRSYNENK